MTIILTIFTSEMDEKFNGVDVLVCADQQDEKC
jgi:hypothetical protein